jgi:hypothetical protein
VAYRFRERGGLAAAGRFPFLRCVALAVDKPAQARSFCGDRRVAGLVCTAPSYGISQFCGSTVIAWAGHRLRDLRGPRQRAVLVLTPCSRSQR